MIRIDRALFVTAALFFVACAEEPRPESRTGVELKMADPVRGIAGSYLSENGVRLDFVSEIDANGDTVTTVTSGALAVASVRMTATTREMILGGIDVGAAVRADDPTVLEAMHAFYDTDEAVALMELAGRLRDELGDEGRELVRFTRDFGTIRMAFEVVTERPFGPTYDRVAVGYTDACWEHGYDYVTHSDGSHDDISDDLAYYTTGGGGGGGGGGGEVLAYGGCYGCCGAGCWGCTGIYTAECASHDSCVAQYGHWRCLDGEGGYASLWAAFRSMF